MIYLTADLHLGHFNIIRFTNRPYQTVEEMDTDLINRWNSVVGHNDTIYVLGDFTLSGIKTMELYLEVLHGQIRIIPGSHDYRWLEKWQDTEQVKVLPPLVSLEFPEYGTKEHPLVVVCSHYALRVWDRSHYGSLHCYGHSHGTLPGLGRSLDVGIDTHGFYPYSLTEIIIQLTPIEPHNAPKSKNE